MKLKSYLDYGTFQPIQIAATVTMNENPEYPEQVRADVRVAPQRAVRRARPHRLGRAPTARGSMFVWAPIPEPYADLGRSSSRPR